MTTVAGGGSRSTVPALSGRPGLMLATATIGFAVNFWAWALLSPLGPLFRTEGTLGSLSESDVALLVAVPVIVGSLGRLPVGALTDRLGGRVMFPLVSAATIVPILFIGFIGLRSYVGLLIGGFFLGISGTAFAVGVPFVNAWYPPERRGLAIGIFGAGMGGTAISALTTVKLYTNGGERVPFLISAVVLAVYAVTAWLVLRDAPGRTKPSEPLLNRLVANAKLPITWQACILYAVAFGGYVAFSVYLPAYLKTAYDLEAADAANRMAGFVIIAVLMRPVGGWLSDKFGPIPVLTGGVCGRRRRRSRCRDNTAARAHRSRRVPGHGRRPRIRQRCHLRAHRQGHRPVEGRRRDGSGGRGGRPRRIRAALDHGLHLRPYGVVRDRTCAAFGDGPVDPAPHGDAP
jgi:NNP family nitrate/nitrite transporter-like MFS transporter